MIENAFINKWELCNAFSRLYLAMLEIFDYLNMFCCLARIKLTHKRLEIIRADGK